MVSPQITVKKYENIKVPVRVDSVTNEYIIAIPESYVNELNWYEDTEVNISLSDNGLYIEEE
tara:strand:- start:1619 stop:1804 length:186 start_codon:yes stop_codon:yes gene_type:complete